MNWKMGWVCDWVAWGIVTFAEVAFASKQTVHCDCGRALARIIHGILFEYCGATRD